MSKTSPQYYVNSTQSFIFGGFKISIDQWINMINFQILCYIRSFWHSSWPVPLLFNCGPFRAELSIFICFSAFYIVGSSFAGNIFVLGLNWWRIWASSWNCTIYIENLWCESSCDTSMDHYISSRLQFKPVWWISR